MKTEMFRNATSRGRAAWMVVDDNKSVLDFLKALLESLNIARVHCFASGAEALAAFAAGPEDFELVVTDLEMPAMDGIELLRRLRAISPRLKVLLATGNALITDQEAARYGFCGLVPKPFSTTALFRATDTARVSRHRFNAGTGCADNSGNNITASAVA